jgi:uncharacterized membrane protein YgcG
MMDAARRWQIASIAGAVTSVAMGGILLARPSEVPAAPIQLTIVSNPAPGAPDVPVDPPGAEPDGPVLVWPDVVEVIPDGQTPSSPPTPSSPDEPASGSSSTSSSSSGASSSPSSSSSTSSSGTGSSSSGSATTSSSPRPADPDSVDSVSSVSSDD